MVRKIRSQNGSMLIMVLLTIGLVLACGLLGISLSTFFTEKEHSQSKVDSMALTFASRINSNNRVGQMNEMMERSRALVYLSREKFIECNNEYDSFLMPLCHQLISESYDGHALLERERRNQIKLITRDMQQTAIDHNKNKAGNVSTFLGFRIFEPRITRIELGRIANLPSNVHSPDMLPNLAQHDRQFSYLENGCNLYRGNINAKLPDATDTCLHFKFSPLSPCVDQVSSPARNANLRMFVPSACVLAGGKEVVNSVIDYTPNAVNLTCTMTVALNGSDAASTSHVDLNSTGVTCGAGIESSN